MYTKSLPISIPVVDTSVDLFSVSAPYTVCTCMYHVAFPKGPFLGLNFSASTCSYQLTLQEMRKYHNYDNMTIHPYVPIQTFPPVKQRSNRNNCFWSRRRIQSQGSTSICNIKDYKTSHGSWCRYGLFNIHVETITTITISLRSLSP